MPVVLDVKRQDGDDDPVAEHDHEQNEGQDIEVAFGGVHSFKHQFFAPTCFRRNSAMFSTAFLASGTNPALSWKT